MSNLKVLVVDDTVTYRRILAEVVNSIAGAEVMATANNGKIALAKIRQDRPDVVLLDMVMPEMDGLETLRHIKKDYPEIGVIMVSGSTAPQAAETLKALELGALDFISKPEGADPLVNFQELKDGVRPLLTLFLTRRHISRATEGLGHPAVAVKTAAKPAPPSPEVAHRPQSLPTGIRVLVIGVSTGGPNALAEVIPRLPAGFRVPVLIVQHMPPSFTASLAGHLGRKSPLPVKEAKEGDHVCPGQVLIAPGGRHMTVKAVPGGAGSAGRIVVALNDFPPVNSCRPSVDVLFRSIAECYGGGSLAVIMTGMGEDGARGVRDLKDKGCYCLAQNEETCTVYGMPRAVVEARLADEVLPLDQIALRIMKIVGG
ncbi:MAG: chemotaxis response regulator protein-glutamate methylesterase [Pseudomonadota bacterium]